MSPTRIFCTRDGVRLEVRVVTWLPDEERAVVVPVEGGETFEVDEADLEYVVS